MIVIMAADTRLLNKVDLNLLKIFRAVYELGQTTAAAEYLGLTQPAVSQALRRLRELTGDPLFVPGRAGMIPTARAQELAGPFGEALAAVKHALESNRDFQPATARRRFRLGMLDYGVMALAPSVAAAISARAPGVSVEIMHVPSNAAQTMLEEDRIDLVTGPFKRSPASFERTLLFADNYVLIARRNHPALCEGLTPAVLSELAYVEVTYDTAEGGGVDGVLLAWDVRRRKAMQVPLFAGACFVAGASDLVAIVPERLAQIYAAISDIEIHQLPQDFPPLDIRALMHRRNGGDAGLRWLCGVLVEGAKKQEPRRKGRGSH
jgi:DNA-binding transcriptional LysR family regulator